jgi:ABC-type tungstate transport system permease subunit
MDEMKKLGEDMWKDAMNIKFTAQRLAWYMRGGISMNDILNMSTDEFNNLNKIIEDNLETTKKSKMPFF